jgi:hypothetical protein
MVDEFGTNRFCRESRLPPGCRAVDLERGVSRLDDLPPEQLWRLLTERQQTNLYRQFFRREWGELSACLDEHEESENRQFNGRSLGNSLRALWMGWRNAAVRRMAVRGQIQLPH